MSDTAELRRVAVVTGGSRGIGRAVCLQLARQGCCVVVNYCHGAQAAAETADLCRQAGAEALTVQADVSTAEGCAELFRQAAEQFGRVDILVNNAGISWIGLLQDMDVSQWNTLIASNLSSVFHCCKLAVPGMIKKQSGRIVNISSVWGVCGASCEAAYSASKGGVGALTQALAKELAPSGIQVNAIACGAIDTEMNGFLSAEEEEALLDEIPAGRMGRPEEVADVVFAMTGSPDYLTGQILRLDGGWI